MTCAGLAVAIETIRAMELTLRDHGDERKRIRNSFYGGRHALWLKLVVFRELSRGAVRWMTLNPSGIPALKRQSLLRAHVGLQGILISYMHPERLSESDPLSLGTPWERGRGVGPGR